MQYNKVITRKKYEEVFEVLHEKITSGKLQPGDRLDSVEHLAEQFAVSRSAIREALSALNAMGLIEIKQGSGTFVKQFSEENLHLPLSKTIVSNRDSIPHLLELRKIIEVGTAVSAAKHRSQDDIQKLEQILQKMKEVQGDGELGEQVDFEFHATIAAASQNPLLVNLLAQVSDLMLDTMRATRRLLLFSSKTASEQLYDEHMQIFLAIKQQNTNLAELAMFSHLSNVENALITYIEETMY
ncbi:FadR/GntR family transcriptional regulator [Solibacillus daqui]|uniref:FadR/GntR family transcriptional regulator n=1 Tax=Solibacillus daqui TaxID=2912187 RepID=UPI00236562C5|nr:FadR/GntR family transcriptional regulator [Solibacillus daqui]